MYSKSSLNSMNKRSHDEECTIQRPRKRQVGVSVERKIYMFRILLPNGTTLEIRIPELRDEMPIEDFIDTVRIEYSASRKQEASKTKRRIKWEYQDLHFTDASTRKIKEKVNFRDFVPNKWQFLWLHDGLPESDTYEGMWDLTPDTDLLKELPDDYTFETALADLIDNSLQALWSNDNRDAKLIRVDVCKNKITIFDSGPGMNGADGNLVNWGKMGSSLHRIARGKALGGKPPYLVPSFGMFGYGGFMATMSLGRSAIVSSKVKECKKVYTLHLDREAQITSSHMENSWKREGGTRYSSKDEKENSPHGSFMKVEIFDPRMRTMDKKHLLYKLKDIYFPYIQNDEPGKITMPIKFLVNGIDLVGIRGGEVAQTNLHSCNGPDFILQLHFSITQDPSSVGQYKRVNLDANARLKFVYFPVVKGKESFQSIIDSLDADGYGYGETFESFSRVSIRRLGRLLPDARWPSLPFMVPKPKKGERAKMLKMCCSRVKCFIDTDGGFNPTPQKTDLAHHHAYTVALKTFGDRTIRNDEGVRIEILKDRKEMTLPSLEKLYTDWISEMHEKYDEDIDGGVDQPTIVFNVYQKKLDLSSDVLRIHKKIKRGDTCWTAGQKIKVLRGACAGCHNNNVYATLEYMVFEGLPGDAGGEARLICRPLGLPESRGCQILKKEENAVMNIRDSLVLPIRIIDSQMCIPVDDKEWKDKASQKLPSTIDLLSQSDCNELGIKGGMRAGIVNAGDDFPACIVAVIRPKLFSSGKGFKSLDPKFIVKVKLEMILEVKFFAYGRNEKCNILSLRESPSSQNGLNGLYVFHLKPKSSNLFEKAGKYTFLFSLVDADVRLEQVLRVQASADASKWVIVKNMWDSLDTVRAGTVFGPLPIECCDTYGNRVDFTRVPELIINLSSSVGTVLAQEYNVRGKLSTDKSVMTVEGIVIKSSNLDHIRPSYEATLKISTPDETSSLTLCCKVLPGTPKRITAHPADLRMQLIPGQIIEELALEIFDEFGNHAQEDETISLVVDGFSYQHRTSVLAGATCVKKVDSSGFVDISHFLKVSTGYGKDVSVSVTHDNRAIFRMDFKTVMRELRTVSQVFKNCKADSQLKNIVFEVTDSEGRVDKNVHHNEKLGQSHTLTIKSDTFDIDDSVQYTFCHGSCTIRSISLPQTEGIFSFTAAHSCYPELSLDIEVHVENAWEMNQGDDRGTNCEVPGGHVVTSQDVLKDFGILPQTHLNISKTTYDCSFPLNVVENVLPAIPDPSDPMFRNNEIQNKISDALPVDCSFPLNVVENVSSAVPAPSDPEFTNNETQKMISDALPVDCSFPLNVVENVSSAVPDPSDPEFTNNETQKMVSDALPVDCSFPLNVVENVSSAVPAPSDPEFTNNETQNMVSDALPVTSFGFTNWDNSGYSATVVREELVDDLLAYNSAMTESNTKLKSLECTLEALESTSVISDHTESSMYSKQFVLEKIRRESKSAGAFICKFQDELPIDSQRGSLFGIVALLATVDNIDLSRILAQYLGNDLMRAVVCTNYDAAKSLDVRASKHNDSACGGYFAVCLDDIRSFSEDPSNNPEAPLPLQLPTLPNGNRPKGFLGYAINMISVEATESQWRTTSGHGLRETLFYSLLGELQVYDKRSRMMRAQSCIKNGAISLDGGIMRGNGLLSFGKWDPDMIFPVRHNRDTSRYLQILKVKRELEDARRSYNTWAMKFYTARERYNMSMSIPETTPAWGSGS